MNLLIIWLIVSVVCTGIVLVCIRFAPRMEDEPLNSCGEPEADLNRRYTPDARRPKSPACETRGEIRSIHRPKPGKRAPLAPKLSHFVINRPEESQS
ncbi:hypothetical protein Enr13x_49250 [Stieleria neptunia]|uniref:Uncharacterized protein n=1 Tax=Stieleria neptunia TaxID=2527979 RepID=A0A518HW28_9BACT|nr:hypothetical protein [Stieleria neptunia]QDV45052.1 hypothetical protein Enr13x_49250 [Stieleria neptunia]